MGKLVRDKIPELIRAEGREPETVILNQREFEVELCNKLLEEAQELKEAVLFRGNREHFIEELADCLEVIHAIGIVGDVSFNQIKAAAKAKGELRGFFTQRIWLEDGS